MQDWRPDAAPGFGWPLGDRTWINPSPNAPNLWMARAYAGTVMLEGTTLSEGRGTTRPLELFGAPDIDARAVLKEMERLAPHWLDGCRLRECWFEPTFHKHVGKLCHGVQIHTEDPWYGHDAFKPWRIQALAFKAIRRLYPDYPLWRDFPYEYEHGKLAIDVINGSPLLREWVDDSSATPQDLDALTHTGRAGVGERAAAIPALRTAVGYSPDRVDCGSIAFDSSALPSIQVAMTLSSCVSATKSARAPGSKAPRSFSRPRNARGRERSGAQRMLQRHLRQLDRIAHRRSHVQVRAGQRALFRGQPSVDQLDRPADTVRNGPAMRQPSAWHR